MTNTAELLRIIEASGLKKKFIADSLGLTYYGFQRKVENKTEFKASEMDKLCNLLGLDMMDKERIFFCC